MPVFLLPDDLPVFPDPRQAEPEGLLALGGGLEPARLLLAYSRGIFPWSSEGEPLMWFSPSPRMVLRLPGDLHVGRSLRKQLRRRPLRITLDLEFAAVMAACAEPRDGQEQTWITAGIVASFTALHRLGVAHSVEVWDGETMVGGLYGLAIGGAFFGESMFSRESGASKQGFIALARQLIRWDYRLIDCQMTTGHLGGLGGQELEREAFLAALDEAVRAPGRLGPWRFDAAPTASEADDTDAASTALTPTA
ncbi:MAG: leucyl/phenylalanyl-tRNA--protein transferase [Nannocystis sp.]|nr:leucyl/phenylalanyl-tRNA--protein transferase [Nannocystis sp.]MBA3549085.1 leucyl/phenylalanyl-tRNA--protein transferase [Nannocystis sp.]